LLRSSESEESSTLSGILLCLYGPARLVLNVQ
jgi:hypothetical protein